MSYQTITTGLRTASADITTFKSVITGISIIETGGASSITVKLFQGQDNTGTLMWSATVPSSQSLGEDFSNPISIKVQGHFYLEKTGAGTAAIVVRGR